MKFSDFLIEAQFKDDDLTRIITAFERRLPKLLGAKLYRSGGKTGSAKVGSSTAYIYFFDDRAFQIRVKGGHVLGVDVWNKFYMNKGPSYTIDISDLNSSTILGSIKKLADLIKHPVEGKIPVNVVSESIQLDEMAKRVSDEVFYSLVVKQYGETKAHSLSWNEIKNVADANDVLIPGYIRGNKVGRGLWDADPKFSVTDVSTPAAEPPSRRTELVTVDDTEVVDGKKSPILYIKVTAQDPDTKRFIPSGNSKEAQALYGQLQKAVRGPATEPELKDPDTLYGHMAQLVEMACRGTLRSLLIYGGPGTGKTYTIMQTVEKLGLAKGKDYVKLSGKASPIEIYKTLFMYRDGGLVIFDDLDSMWGNEDATNILKAALDTSPVREISWASAQTINVSKMSDERKQDLFAQIDRQINGEDEFEEELDDEEDDKKRAKKKPKAGSDKIKYPSTFDFKGRVVFISNLKKQDFDTAIMSRSAKINMDLTAAQILQRMRKILPTLGGTDVTVEMKEQLLDRLLEMHGEGLLDAVTMREFIKGLDIVRSGVPNWKELLVYA